MAQLRYSLVSIILSSIALLPGCRQNITEIMTVTGATPLALQESVPTGFSLHISGMVKKEYDLSSYTLNKFATARIRTREVSPGGEFEGAYVYTGIPLYNILEGVTPKKARTAVFDRPLDMIVTFHSSAGKKVRFSYGELTMTNDCHPVTLAFHRRQVLPSKDPEKYTKNRYKENIKGFRLICPREPDTSRYLDDVAKITLDLIAAPDDKLPKMKKNAARESKEVDCLDGEMSRMATFDGIGKQKVDNWVRIGHGRGFKEIADAGGYNLRAFLRKNFPGCGAGDFFLFVACDGYRAVFSGREIFSTGAGASYLILDDIDGKTPTGNYMLAPIDDYFVDRDVWGLSHIVHIREVGRVHDK